MELKQGYKHTEIGVIPKDWGLKDLLEVVTFLDGQRKPIKSNDRIAGDYPYYGASGIIDYVSDYIFDDELILLGEDGENIISRNLPLAFKVSGKIWVNNHAHVLKPKEDINITFLTEFLESLDYKLLNSGTAQPKLNKQACYRIKIAFPTLLEQTAIANALSDMDALISQTEKLIEKKKAIKQGAMQELLKPKEDWVTKKLGEIGVISGAGVDKKINANENAVRLLNYMDVYKRDFIYSRELEHWVTAPVNKLANCSVKQGDVFFTPSSETRTDIGLAAVAMEDISDAVYSYHVMRFRLLQDWDLKFRGYIFQTKNFLDQTEKMCEGGGKRYVLTMPKFRSLLITYPESKIEQQEISLKLWDIDQELILWYNRLSKLKQQKQGMMQALLTGKIRLVS